jgi:hypothetical protein
MHTKLTFARQMRLLRLLSVLLSRRLLSQQLSPHWLSSRCLLVVVINSTTDINNVH